MGGSDELRDSEQIYFYLRYNDGDIYPADTVATAVCGQCAICRSDVYGPVVLLHLHLSAAGDGMYCMLVRREIYYRAEVCSVPYSVVHWLFAAQLCDNVPACVLYSYQEIPDKMGDMGYGWCTACGSDTIPARTV